MSEFAPSWAQEGANSSNPLTVGKKMMLDISHNDRKILYGMQRKLCYMQAQAGIMADQYADDSEEAAAIADVGAAMAVPLMKVDDILIPD